MTHTRLATNVPPARRALSSWTNPKGETVVQHAGGLTVLPKGASVAQWESREVAQHRERQARQDRTDRVAQIEAAIEGTGCVALLNETTGVVAFVKPPVPYYEQK